MFKTPNLNILKHFKTNVLCIKCWRFSTSTRPLRVGEYGLPPYRGGEFGLPPIRIYIYILDDSSASLDNFAWIWGNFFIKQCMTLRGGWFLDGVTVSSQVIGGLRFFTFFKKMSLIFFDNFEGDGVLESVHCLSEW